MSDLTEMWAALERYQPSADAAGHGDSWKRMTTERTKAAAFDAMNAAYPSSREAAYAAVNAFGSTYDQTDKQLKIVTSNAIKHINAAKEDET